MNTTYQPRPEAARILNAAMAHIRSVEYQVGLRWVMYRLLQDGVLNSKDDYAKLKTIAAAARKGFFGDWRPDTLIDEGRHVSTSRGITTAAESLEFLPYYAKIHCEMFAGQQAVPFLLYEAATMDGQFEHFAGHFDRAALRGDASIPHKYDIARRCDVLARRTGLPVHVLYFGDFDPKGLVIPESAMADIRAWVSSSTELRFTRVGINADHPARFNLPEKIEKPGTYEWESLSSEDAGTLIADALADVVDMTLFEQRLAADEAASDALAELVGKALESIDLEQLQ